MSSPTSSSSLSLTPSQLIDNILNTTTDDPGFNLDGFVETIDKLLVHYTNKQEKRSPIRELIASVVECVPSASNTSKFSEGVSKNVKTIAQQISESSRDKHQQTIAVLNAIGNVHWVGVGFLLVAAVLEKIETIQNNKLECLRLLKSMNELAKVIRQLQGLPHLKSELQTKMKESISLTVEGAISCCSQQKRTGCGRCFKASNDARDLQELGRRVDEMREQLHLQISTSNLEIGTSVLEISTSVLEVVQRSVVCNQPAIPDPSDTVGIRPQINEVIRLLDWENDNPAALAVVVYGVGGSGQTTLADAVYASLKDKLQGWKHSKITLIQHLEKEPEIGKLQSQILQDLTGIKQEEMRDSGSGGQTLKDIIEKESIFLYIDNALYKEPLKKLLPKEVANPKKLRLLVTARKNSVKEIIEECNIKPCEIYQMEPLPLDAALQILCTKVDRERDTNSILTETPLAKAIAEKCICSPLFLELVGGYLHKRKNKPEAYQRVIDYLEGGEPFSCDKEDDSFEKSGILFAYDELQPSAQEAFLDICSFFRDRWQWEWETVSCIVGEEEMECLKEGALLKRKEDKISIHDLILAAGLKKSKKDRFTKGLDFSQLEKIINSQIKGVWLENTRCDVSAEELDTMSGSLRVFAMGRWTIVKGKCSKQFEELRFLRVGDAPNLPIEIPKLKHLTYLDYAFKNDMNLSSCEDLANLEVLKFRKCDGSHLLGLSEWTHLDKLKELVLVGCNTTEIPRSFVKLQNLRKLSLLGSPDLEELPESIGKLRSLQQLDLSLCRHLKQLTPKIGELSTLASLELSCCTSLKELPIELENLSSLKTLELEMCESLEELPQGLENLSSLQILNLSCCSSLLQLPERLGKLTSLTRIQLDGCKKLSNLPHSLGEITSLSQSSLSLNECSSLIELPEEICKLTMLKYIYLEKCYSLSRLPSHFKELTKLQELYLGGCKSLSSLPQGFGKLSSLERLDLSKCYKLDELSSDFYCLPTLKRLELSRCTSLTKLPIYFGKLSCLEDLNLSGCSNLKELSDDFQCLSSLRRLNLSNCERLGGEWMDSVGAIQSLWRLDILGSERMIQRWMEMQRDKQEWHFVVVTDSLVNTEEGSRALLLEGTIVKLFEEEGLLLDIHQNPFNSSSLPPDTPLILIIDRDHTKYFESPPNWKLLEKNLQQLECKSRAFRIIYVGREFNALKDEFTHRILAYTPAKSRASLIFDIFQVEKNCVFRSIDGLGEKGIKCLSMWKDISYIFNEVAFLAKTPRESNIELLRALLVTDKTDFLLLNNKEQVKVNDLEGKIVVLLIMPVSRAETFTSALKDMYVKMRHSSNSSFEVVWIPSNWYAATIEKFERAATNALWPVVSNPGLINEDTVWSLNDGGGRYERAVVVVVDEKGRISCKDAVPMIERWGVEAYPFSQSREEELRKAEWEEFNFNSQSTLEFLILNSDFTATKAKEAEMKLLCVGSAAKMVEFAPDLNCALTKLGSDIQVFYVGSSDTYYEEEEEYEAKRKEMCSIQSFSFSSVYKFWRRVKQVSGDLSGMGVDEKTMKVRRMVLGFASADVESGRYKEEKIRVVVVDENGEMISGKGREVIEAVLEGDKEEQERMVCDMKSEGMRRVVERRWRDGMIHPRHHPQHPLLQIHSYYHHAPRVCSLCFERLRWHPFQCNVCGNFVICEPCYSEIDFLPPRV